MGFQLALSAGIALVTDQITKILVLKRLSLGQSIPLGVFGRICHFSQPPDSRKPAPNRLKLMLHWGLALGGITLAVQSGHFFQQLWAQVALGVALGGATSNLCDRLRSDSVIDFIEVGWWPAFNLADVAIVVGILVCLYSIRST